MNFADNWARVFVVGTCLTFGEAQIIGAIRYFAFTSKMAEMFGLKKLPK